MNKLPRISGKNVIKLLCKTGYYIKRQKGSHVILKHKSYPENDVVVPLHRELDKGTLNKIIKQSFLSKKEFISLLK